MLLAPATHAQTATTTAAPPTTLAATTTAASGTTPAPLVGGGPTTAAPAALVVSRCDLIFTSIAQDTTSQLEYRRIIAATLNVTTRRVQFESTGQGRVGYLFGDEVRVRIVVDTPISSEVEQRPSIVIRDALVDIANANDVRYTEIGVQSAEAVDSLDVYTYQVFTAWDVVWTLLIIGAGVGFLGFCAFIGYRFHRALKFRRAEAEAEAKEQELAALAAETEKKSAAAKKESLALTMQDDDFGGDEDPAEMEALVAQLNRQMRDKHAVEQDLQRREAQAREDEARRTEEALMRRFGGGGDEAAARAVAAPDASVKSAAAETAFTSPTERFARVDGSRANMHNIDAAPHGSQVAADMPVLHLASGNAAGVSQRQMASHAAGPGQQASNKSDVAAYLNAITLPPADNSSDSASAGSGRNDSRPPINDDDL